MARLSFYHDTRSGKDECPIKIRISQGKEKAYISLGVKVSPENWNSKDGVVVGHERAKQFNAVIGSEMEKASKILNKLELAGEIGAMSASRIKEIIENNGTSPNKEESKDGNFIEIYTRCMESKNKPNTRSSYMQTLVSMRKFDALLDMRAFEDIDIRYLESYDRWMAERGIRQNSRNVYYRNIRTVFNYAIDEEITAAYPFRKFKMKRQSTKKRSLTIDELRTLRDYPVEDWQKKYVDLFFLMFYLIGINAADILPAKRAQVRNGRFEYERAKTYKDYSIKIEPEAQKLIDRYKGKDHLLKFCDEHADYKYILQRMSKVLKTIGPYEVKGRGGKHHHNPLFPELSQYWCRHTWATIAAELDIPKETIAAALGHDMGNTTTAIYINFNQKKVDEANRRVIDFLNEK